MRVLGLVSGGKDSCYNLIECVREGHDIVALGNLKPIEKDELDSFMYQTVGHGVIDLYAEALGLPLFRKAISGRSLVTELNYECNEDDEVEDLHILLKDIQEKIAFEAVAVGAILSDYQRIRVENVCARLGIKCLAYLWQREQGRLLQDMIDSQVHAVLIKVATLGLLPRKHLMSTIEQIQNHLQDMSTKFGINICGEGGEYETMTLDCPLFLKEIIIDEFDIVIHSDDAFAPVGYVKFQSMHLEDKGMDPGISLKERLDLCHFPSRLSEEVKNRMSIRENLEEQAYLDFKDQQQEKNHHFVDQAKCTISKHGRDLYISGFVCNLNDEADVRISSRNALADLNEALQSYNCSLQDCIRVHLYLRDMTLFAVVNEVYKEFCKANPPTRVCVEVSMPENRIFCLECQAIDNSSEIQSPDLQEIKTLHVQSISHWAPANIGPYSQAKKVGSLIFVSGSIGLDAGSMRIIPGGIVSQAQLALGHVDSVIKAIESSCCLGDAFSVICYVVMEKHKSIVEDVFWEYFRSDASNRPVFQVIVVSRLPRNALVEWSVVVHSSPGEKLEAFNFETGMYSAKVISGLCPYSCKRIGYLSLAVDDDALEHCSPTELVEGVLEDIKRCLSHCGLEYKRLHALQVYYNIDSLTKLDVIAGDPMLPSRCRNSLKVQRYPSLKLKTEHNL